MFLRRLTAFGSFWSTKYPALYDGWKSLHFPRYPCPPGAPPWTVINLSRHFSGALQLADPHSRTGNSEKGSTYFVTPLRALHLSSGLMEGSSKDPPHRQPPYKRRRSAEDQGHWDGSQTPSPRKEAPRQARSPKTSPKTSPANPNGWLRNGDAEPPPPGVNTDTTSSSPHGPTRQMPPLLRQWEEFSYHYDLPWSHRVERHGASRPWDFTLLSYNLLSQDLLRDNAYLYQHCPAALLAWRYRLPNLLRELGSLDADIVCLQEVQEDHYQEQIRPALEARGYQCEYKRRTGRKPDGCAVAFKKGRFSLLSSHPVEYLRPGVPLLDRDNVALILLLQPLGQSQPSAALCVANTHLLYNPRRGDIKLTQLALLLAEMGRVSRLPDGASCPAVLCGDLNSVPWSPLYCFLRKACLEYEGLPTAKVSGQEENTRGQRVLTAPLWPATLGLSPQCQYQTHCSTTDGLPPAVEEGVSQETPAPPRIEHPLRLSSAYSHQRHDGKPEITTCHSRSAITVDYILYTPAAGDVAAHTESSQAAPLPGGRGLQLLGRLGLVGQSELMKVNSLPNENHSSDHLPLLARFRLRP